MTKRHLTATREDGQKIVVVSYIRDLLVTEYNKSKARRIITDLLSGRLDYFVVQDSTKIKPLVITVED